jgi:hypothetical protein
MPEIIVNLHMHTCYSDGTGTHAEIAKAAIKTGLDAVIVTDHNVFVEGVEGYYNEGERRVLLLVGEEIHDQARLPQKSHLLVFGAGEELAAQAADLERLMNTIRKKGALAFAAHPVDPPAPAVHEDDLSWEDWQVTGLTGLEIWNAMSEFKSLLKSKLHAIYYAYNPDRIARGPFPDTLRKWDELLESGQVMVAIGGSDAHALNARLGPLKRTLFPYEYHFRAVNTHLLIEKTLTGVLEIDSKLILDAMRGGRAFVANDMLASARGFNFSAQGYGRTAGMGEEITAERGVTLQIRLPPTAPGVGECRLMRDGKTLQTWQNQSLCTYITSEPGAYRIEAFLSSYGRSCGWIYSNPIYVRPNGSLEK